MFFNCCTSKPPRLYLEELGDEAYSGNTQALALFRQAKDLELKHGSADKITALFKQAAELNLVAAQAEYGICIVDTDRPEARKWFQKAADKNNEIAIEYLNFLASLPDDQPTPTTIRYENKVTFVTGFPGSA